MESQRAVVRDDKTKQPGLRREEKERREEQKKLEVVGDTNGTGQKDKVLRKGGGGISRPDQRSQTPFPETTGAMIISTS